MKKTFAISAEAVHLAIKFLREHALLLKGNLALAASGEVVYDIAQQIEDEVALQTPQSLEQQVAKLTDIMGVGPEDEAVGNKG